MSKESLIHTGNIMQVRKVTISSKGQITRPKDIRVILKIGPGHQIDFIFTDEGEVCISPRTGDIRSLKGLFHKVGRKTAFLEDMANAIKKGASGTIS